MAICKNCGAEITWLKTKNDKNIPVDGLTLKEGEDKPIYDRLTMKCHFDSCGKDVAKKGETPAPKESAQAEKTEEIPF